MARLAPGRHEIIVRAAFVGPPGAGKRTTVRWLAARAAATERGELSSDGTTLSVTLAPNRLATVSELPLRLELVTAAGGQEEQDPAPALRSADVVVFVAFADGRPENATAARALGSELGTTPVATSSAR